MSSPTKEKVTNRAAMVLAGLSISTKARPAALKSSAGTPSLQAPDVSGSKGSCNKGSGCNGSQLMPINVQDTFAHFNKKTSELGEAVMVKEKVVSNVAKLRKIFEHKVRKEGNLGFAEVVSSAKIGKVEAAATIALAKKVSANSFLYFDAESVVAATAFAESVPSTIQKQSDALREDVAALAQKVRALEIEVKSVRADLTKLGVTVNEHGDLLEVHSGAIANLEEKVALLIAEKEKQEMGPEEWDEFEVNFESTLPYFPGCGLANGSASDD